ncbi:hypothetical protein Tco_0592975 [Tanacetum coccineum]
MAPKRATRSTPVTENPTTTTVTNAQLQAMIDQGVTAALTARDANRNGDDSHTSGTALWDCVELTHWLKGMVDCIPSKQLLLMENQSSSPLHLGMKMTDQYVEERDKKARLSCGLESNNVHNVTGYNNVSRN